MVTNAIHSISLENVKRAFECCGIAAHGASVPEERLNERLRTVLSWRDSHGLVEERELHDDEDDDGIGAGSGEEEIIERRENDPLSDLDYLEEF